MQKKYKNDYLTEDNKNYYTKIEKNMTYKIEYIIVTSDKVYSKGTYDENEIIKLAD